MTQIQDIKEDIALPEGVTAQLEGDRLIITGEKGKITRFFSHPKISVELKDNHIHLRCQNPRRKQKALFGTFRAHINNMITGVTQGFEYHMKTVYSHFPIKTAVEGNRLMIQNFLGERHPRHASIAEGVSVDISGDDLSVKGTDKEKVGQTVANIERATAVKRRDIRVFQDGIYRIDKGGGQ